MSLRINLLGALRANRCRTSSSFYRSQNATGSHRAFARCAFTHFTAAEPSVANAIAECLFLPQLYDLFGRRWKKELVMRKHFHTVVPATVTLLGLISALSAPASAGEVDPASAVRGSLGVSLEDLVFGTGAGASVFLVNAGFALLFAAVAIGAGRRKSRGTGHIPLRPSRYFAR
jgi:hypothetical protein